MMPLEQLDRFWRRFRDLAAVLPVHEVDQGLRQKRQIAFALPKRRKVDPEHVQTIEQILAQLALSAGPPRRVLFVEAITRTSTAISLLPPRRRTRESSRTRSSLACVPTGISASSSSSSVPCCASSKQPARRSTAPVKAPFSCPNSSLSIRVSGIAAQLMATNGAAASRAEVVDGPGDEFFTGAALARDQHRRFAGATC